MRAIFVAGTDTGVGKTVVTGLLARHLATRGYSVATQKWVQTGGESDLDEHLRWMGRTREEFRGFLKAMAPYSLRAPASPHLAAELAARRGFSKAGSGGVLRFCRSISTLSLSRAAAA